MSKKKQSANKKKRKAPKTAWKPGQSGNPKGRPKDGESWAGSLKWAFNLSGNQAAKIAPPDMAREFRRMGKMQLRQALCLRLVYHMLCEPSGALFNAMADREEGKIPQTINQNITWKDIAIQNGIDPDWLIKELFGQFAQVGEGSGDPGSLGTMGEAKSQ